MTSSRLLLAAAAALALGAGSAACVTRTVYVVDDNPRNDLPRTAAAPAQEQVPQDDGGPAVAYEESAGIASASDFYEPLSPYGRWVSYPGYGQVFVPSAAVVGAGFRPYTHGHWEYSEWGWTWVDHHPFGWATGHYGRWFYDGSYGWVWVPGTVWSPAWVTWRTGGGYVGWAALPPGADYGGVYTVYDTSWVFVSSGSMGVGYVGSAIIVGSGYRTCYASTYPARDTVVYYGHTYYRGPDYDDVQRHGGHVIHRPARDADRDHPVTRPPSGTARPGSGHGGGAGRPHDSGEPSGSSRPGRDDDGGRDGGTSGRGGYDDDHNGTPRPGRGDDASRGDSGRGDSGRGDSGRGDSGRGGDGDHASGGGYTGSRDTGGRTAGDRDADGPRYDPSDALPSRDDPRPGRSGGATNPRDALEDLNPNPTARPIDVMPTPIPSRDGPPAALPPPSRTGRGDDDSFIGTRVGNHDARDGDAAPARPYRPYNPARGDAIDDDGGDDDNARIPYDDVTRPRSDAPIDPDRVNGVTRPYAPSRGATPAPSRDPGYTPVPSRHPGYAPAPSRDPRYTPAPSRDPRYTPVPSRDPGYAPSRDPGYAPPSSSTWGSRGGSPYGAPAARPSRGAPSPMPSMSAPGGDPAPSGSSSSSSSKKKGDKKGKGGSSKGAAAAAPAPAAPHRR